MTDANKTAVDRVAELYQEGTREVARGVCDFIGYRIPVLGRAYGPIRKYGFRHGIPYLAACSATRILSDTESGENVLNRDWDVLILLDTCRPEWIREVEPEFEFLEGSNTIKSVGSRTAEWVTRTFDAELDEQVTYIYGSKYGDLAAENPNVETVFVTPQQWKYPPAHRITEAARELIPQRDQRVIVHYAQPHFPVFETNGSQDNVSVKKESYHGPMKEYLKSGGGVSTIKSLYLDNLRYVLKDVKQLISSLEGHKVAISADHGEALGESYIVGHPHGLNHDAVRTVPWVEIET